MRCLTIELELRSDVIQTAEASSLGVHRCLEYVKGSSLLGAAAARTYEDLGRDAYVAFHSGHVRFLDAVLLTDDATPTLPVPLGWLHPKGRSFESGGTLAAEDIHTVSHLAPGEAARLGLHQIRNGYFTPDGRWASVERRYRLKTAIDRALGGRPDEGRLFGYESLPDGSRWQARIEIDDGVDAEIDEALKSVFDDQLIWLGRSRAAEYGRAHARVAAETETPSALRDDGPSPPGRVAVCLESDTALSDPETGEPTFTARPEAFGLPASWRLEPLRSAVLTRRYSPFNRKRRHRESERLVLRRGSVLTFAGETPADLAAARRHVERGIGMWRQEGLGQARVAPWYLVDRHPKFEARALETAPTEPAVLAPPGPLARWMARRSEERLRSERAFEEGRNAADRLAVVVRKLRRKKKLTPSRSQWNKLAALVSRHLDRPEPAVAEMKKELAETLLKGVGSNAWRAEESEGRPFVEQTLTEGLGPEDRDASERLWQLRHTALLMVRRLSRDPAEPKKERRDP